MPGFWERYRLTFNKRGNDWWSIVFGYPIGRLLAVLLTPVRWIKPDHLTVLGFAFKLLAAAGFCFHSTAWLVVAVVALQLSQVLDCVDGTLARCRGTSSRVGAFLDKATDQIALFALGAVVGVRAFQQTGEVLYTVAGCAGGAGNLQTCYMYWVARSMTPQTAASANIAGVAPVPTWGGIGREWLRGWIRIFKVEEADFHFWIALFAILDQWAVSAVLLGGTQLLAALFMMVQHPVRLSKLPP